MTLGNSTWRLGKSPLDWVNGKLLRALLLLLAISMSQTAAASEAASQAARKATLSFPKPADRMPIKFQFGRGIIVFKVSINGREGWAALDSGAGSSGIDLKFARELGLAIGSPMTPIRPGVGPAVQTLARYRINNLTTVTFPGQMTATVPIAAVDMSSLAATSGVPIVMVVGADFFSHLAFQIDFRNSLLQIGPSGALALADRQSFVGLTDPYRRVKVQIGDKHFELGIDLGYNGFTSLKSDLWEKIEKLGKVRSGYSKNVSGEVFATKFADVRQIDVGNFVVKGVEVKEELPTFDQMDGLIGLGFLREFDSFIIDLKARKLWLQPSDVR